MGGFTLFTNGTNNFCIQVSGNFCSAPCIPSCRLLGFFSFGQVFDVWTTAVYYPRGSILMVLVFPNFCSMVAIKNFHRAIVIDGDLNGHTSSGATVVTSVKLFGVAHTLLPCLALREFRGRQILHWDVRLIDRNV